jgi:hypothetical protein
MRSIEGISMSIFSQVSRWGRRALKKARAQIARNMFTKKLRTDAYRKRSSVLNLSQ